MCYHPFRLCVVCFHGLRGSAVPLTVDDTLAVDGRVEYLGRCAFVEVLALLAHIVALASKVPHRRSVTGMATLCSAILIGYALFAIGGLRGSAIAVTVNDMPKVDERDEYLG